MRPTKSRGWLALAAIALVAAAAVWTLLRDPRAGTQPSTFGPDDLETVELEPGTPSAPPPASTVAREAVELGSVAAGFRIRGRVVGVDGRGVEGAEVRLELPGEGSGARRTRRLRHPVATDRDGAFALDGSIETPGRFVLEVRHPDHAPAVREHVPPTGARGADVGEIRLTAGGAITGEVRDVGGAPIDGATVSLRPAEGNRIDLSTRWRDLLPPVTTGRDGAFAFDRLPAGAYRVEARAPGMVDGGHDAPVHVADSTDPPAIVIRLESGCTLAGTVLDPGGGPVAGAEIRVQDTRSAGPGPLVRRFGHSDADGSFTIDRLPRRELQVEVAAEGFATWRREPVDPITGRALRVELAAGATITGRVVDTRTRKPVTHFAAKVSQGAPELEDETGGPASLPPDPGEPADHPDGRFRFEGLDDGVVTVIVAAPGYVSSRSDPVELGPGARARDVVVHLRRGVALAGVVIATSDRRPVAGCRVELVAGDGEDTLPTISLQAADSEPELGPEPFLVRTSTDAQGEFRFPLVEPGRYALTVRHRGFAPLETGTLDLRADRTDLRMELEALCTVAGRVLDIPTDRLRSVQVIAYGGPGNVHVRRSGADGEFELAGLPAGAYTVRAFVGDARDFLLSRIRAAADPLGAPREVDVRLAAGERRELQLRLERPALGEVVGTVTLSGPERGGMRISLRPLPPAHAGAPSWSGRLVAAVTDTAGGFVLRGVAAGDYVLHIASAAKRGGQEIHRAALTVVEGSPVRADLRIETASLEVRVVSADGSTAAGFDGRAQLLVGAESTSVAPEAWQRGHPVQRAMVRAGSARFAEVPCGPCVIVVEARGHLRVIHLANVVPGGSPTVAEVPVGAAVEPPRRR